MFFRASTSGRHQPAVAASAGQRVGRPTSPRTAASSPPLPSTKPTHHATMLLLRSHHLLLHHAARLSPSTRLLRRAAPLPRAARFHPPRMSTSSSSNASSAAPSPPPPVVPKSKIRFCPACGSPTKLAVPDGDEKMRAVCSSCGRVHYENPKMVVGCLVEHDNKVLLCRRSIEPAYGLWTLPAGYLEVGESAAEGASRETLEEACADVEILSPFAQLDIPLIGQ